MVDMRDDAKVADVLHNLQRYAFSWKLTVPSLRTLRPIVVPKPRKRNRRNTENPANGGNGPMGGGGAPPGATFLFSKSNARSTSLQGFQGTIGVLFPVFRKGAKAHEVSIYAMESISMFA
jgi:hypothetical protein